MQTYLKETWVPTLRSSIRQCLNNINKGWFNLEETNLEVYQGSKLKKLMELTKFAMQVQDSTQVMYMYSGMYTMYYMYMYIYKRTCTCKRFPLSYRIL